MPRIDAKTCKCIAAEILRTTDFYSSPRSFPQAIEAACAAVLSKSIDSALGAELACKKPKILSDLLTLIGGDNRSKDGLFSSCDYLDSSEEVLGFSIPRKGDSRYMESIRQAAPELHKVARLLRNIDPQKFELLCKRILDQMHASDSMQTQYSKDGGIDFVGYVRISESMQMTTKELACPIRSDMYVLIVGQAKRYKNPLGVSHIREMVGTCASFHHDQLAPWDSKFKIPNFGVSTPVLPFIATTGSISRDARILAKQCGVMAKDGAELAIFLGSEKVGFRERKTRTGSRWLFDKSLFQEWLEKIDVS